MKKRLLILLSAFAATCCVGGAALSLPLSQSKAVKAEDGVTAMDFENATDGEAFAAPQYHYGWKVKNGKLIPDNDAVDTAQIGYLAESISLAGNQYIALDFYAASAPFDVVLVPSENFDAYNLASVGLHCYTYDTYGTFQLNTNLDPNGWIADYTDKGDCVDGNIHRLEIVCTNGVLTFKLDGVQVFADNAVNAPADSVNLVLRATKGSYIDNLYIAESAPAGSDESVLDLDFDYASDANYFTAEAVDGWKAKNGKLYPAQAGTEPYNNSAVRLDRAIDLTGTKYISFDFYAEKKPFDVALLDATAVNMWGKSLTAHLPDYTNGVFAVTDNIDVGTWLGADATKFLADGLAHTLEIFVANGKVSYKLDGETPVLDTGATEFDIPAESAYLVFRAAGTDSYIENLYIADSAPADDGNLFLDFESVTDGAAFVGWTSEAWDVKNGVFTPKAAWNSTKLVEMLDLTQNVEIGFDVFLSSTDANKQVNIGLFGTDADTITNTQGSGVCYSLGSTLFLGSSFGRNHWIADLAADLYTDTVYKVTVTVVNGRVSLALDGVVYDDLTTDAPADSAYLIMQSTSTANYFDNFSITMLGDVEVPPVDPGSDSSDSSDSGETPDPEPEVETFLGDVSLDFSDAAHADHFAAYVASDGWKISDGKLIPNNDWSSMRTAKRIELTEDKEISFTAYFSTVGDTKQINIGLFEENVETVHTTANSGMGYSFGSTVWLTSALGRPNGSWVAESVSDFFNGGEHQIKIKIESGKMTLLVDGAQVLDTAGNPLSADVPAEKAYLMVQSTTTANYIDNFVIGDITEDVPPVDPTPDPEPEPTLEYIDTLNADFTDETDGADHFTAVALDGWTVNAEDGTYRPTQEGQMYNASGVQLNKAFDMTGTKYISFDFYSAAKTFDVGFLDVSAVNIWGNALFIHLPFSDGTIGINTYVDCTMGTYLGGSSLNSLGQRHNLKIAVNEGKVSYYLDGELLVCGNGASEFDAPANSAYLIIRGVGTASYIDNLIVSNEDIEYAEPDIDTTYDELELTFDNEADAGYFQTLDSNGWTVKDGAYMPEYVAWAATYLTQKIEFVEENEEDEAEPKYINQYIVFDFLVYPDNDPTATQFNMAFLPDVTNTRKCIGAVHCFVNGSDPVVTVNRGFNKDGQIGDYAYNWADGKYHRMKICIIDGKITFAVDGQTLEDAAGETYVIELSDAELEAGAYFTLQATNVMSRIDNFVISKEDVAYTPYETEDIPAIEDMEQAFVQGEETGFVTGASSNGDWSVNENGQFAPEAGWSVAYMPTCIPLTSEYTIALTVNMSEAVSGHQFTVGFSETAEGAIGLFVMFYQGQVVIGHGMAPQVRLVGQAVNKWFDGQEHILKFVIENGQVAVKMDEEVVFQSLNLCMNSGYFKVQASSTEDYIDDLSIVNYAEPLTTPDPEGDIATKPTDSVGGSDAEPNGNTVQDKTWKGLAITFGVLTGVAAVATVASIAVKTKKKPTGAEAEETESPNAEE